MKKNETFAKKNLIVIDVGSTTTKAILLEKNADSYQLSSLQNSPTTVEKPFEDVNIGIKKAIEKLEKDSDQKLLLSDKSFLNEDTALFCTSSAGGGLQILVIGLTLFDSASSAKRTAFGAGGVLLDTFAIDDKRTSLEQMQEMAILHPDIILISGGIDGGAIVPILRLGEILQLARPTPKFGEKEEIPLIFAGNIKAQEFISSLFSKQFELFLVPNLRPKLDMENLQPAREKIQHLFMDNVMEQAPGYAPLKNQVDHPIIPTPLGVIKSLQIISEKQDKNVMSVDIGGATTDIFSNILGEYFRTVSANYGMSYSIANVLKDADFENVKKWLPTNLEKDFILNYVGNKMLYPTFVPINDTQEIIEQAIAREAIRLSKIQHLDMNFNTKQIGFLEKIASRHPDLEKVTETFYIEKELENRKFNFYDIDILIGAGGIISHTKNDLQALSIITDGFQPEGITEIWRDKYFLSPHLGKLSEVDKKLASKLLSEECYQKLGIVIRPLSAKWKAGKEVMKIEINNESHSIKVNDIMLLDNSEHKKRTLKLEIQKGFYLDDTMTKCRFETELPVLIIAKPEYDFSDLNKVLSLFDKNSEIPVQEKAFLSFLDQKEIKEGIAHHTVKLPYKGNILVGKGQKVDSETIVGENLFDPPRVYVISLFDKNYLKVDKENIADSLLIKEGDEVKYGQRILDIGEKTFMRNLQYQKYHFDSPVRGKVEKINLDSGTIILREIQDYSMKPKKINIAKKLSIQPKLVKRYLKKNVGDFVYAGDTLATIIMDSQSKIPRRITAPSTGSIKDINAKTGILTLQYDREPHKKRALINGKITRIKPGFSAQIEYDGYTLFGIIGFGSETYGKAKYDPEPQNLEPGDIAIFPNKIDLELLKLAQDQKVKGIIAASINNSDLIKFIGKAIGVALTGNENIPFPIILTEGFGDFKMHQKYQSFFQDRSGMKTYLNGHTQIRAGVTRPKIIITK